MTGSRRNIGRSVTLCLIAGGAAKGGGAPLNLP